MHFDTEKMLLTKGKALIVIDFSLSCIMHEIATCFSAICVIHCCETRTELEITIEMSSIQMPSKWDWERKAKKVFEWMWNES